MKTTPEQNKALVLEAFHTLFNKRDYAAAEGFWSESYIQHSAHIPPGRDGLFNLARSLPDTPRYENHVILAEGDYVIAHGRFSGHGRRAVCALAPDRQAEGHHHLIGRGCIRPPSVQSAFRPRSRWYGSPVVR